MLVLPAPMRFSSLRFHPPLRCGVRLRGGGTGNISRDSIPFSVSLVPRSRTATRAATQAFATGFLLPPLDHSTQLAQIDHNYRLPQIISTGIDKMGAVYPDPPLDMGTVLHWAPATTTPD